MKNKVLFQTIILIVSIIISYYLGYMYKDCSVSDNKNNDIVHPIDIEEQKCINKSNVTDYPLCSKRTEESWNKEIQKKLEQLKNVMTKEEFEYIQIMDSNWNKAVIAEIGVINKFIYNKDGIIYQTLGNSEIAKLKKQYAILLYSIYDNYSEEKNGMEF